MKTSYFGSLNNFNFFLFIYCINKLLLFVDVPSHFLSNGGLG